MKTKLVVLCLCVACGPHKTPAVVVSADPYSGGATTALDATSGAYANHAANLSDDHADAFALGHSLFERNWVTAPATTADIDGLGPLFNQRSCSGCHARDGRAAPLDANGEPLNLLFRLSVPGVDAHGGPRGEAAYGTQLRPHAILGVAADANAHVTYTETAGTYGDGTAFSLRTPHYAFDHWSQGEPSTDLLVSARVGPAPIGLGLLEAIREEDIRAGAGKANEVWNVATGTVALGRFGWKANVPTVRMQAAGAFVGDMGITSSLFTSETCSAQMAACVAAPSGGSPEIDDGRLDAVALYMRTLAVPARRNVDDPTVVRGETFFADAGCAACHVATFTTGTFAGLPEVENQTIHPYTDLLLHDMGADLADGRADFLASGSEWRTPPLWGIGLLHTVNGHTSMLHDGRARGFEEAILWHGGEGLAARERFRTADIDTRAALIQFLQSL